MTAGADNVVYVGGESEMSIEGDTEDTRTAVERKRLIVDGDEWGFVRFVSVWSEEGDV